MCTPAIGLPSPSVTFAAQVCVEPVAALIAAGVSVKSAAEVAIQSIVAGSDVFAPAVAVIVSVPALFPVIVIDACPWLFVEFVLVVGFAPVTVKFTGIS